MLTPPCSSLIPRSESGRAQHGLYAAATSRHWQAGQLSKKGLRWTAVRAQVQPARLNLGQ
eukprot:3662073-Alexandrium_andersonii.AAC.1